MLLCAMHKTFTAISPFFRFDVLFFASMQKKKNPHINIKLQQRAVRVDRIEQGYICLPRPVIFSQSKHHMMTPGEA